MATGQRLSIREVDAEAQKSISSVSQYIREGSLEEALHALVEIRASQILVAAWRETGTLFSEASVSDDVSSDITTAFDEKETVQLVMAIAVISVYSRMNVTLRTELLAEPLILG